jgi:hypothetical protein
VIDSNGNFFLDFLPMSYSLDLQQTFGWCRFEIVHKVVHMLAVTSRGRPTAPRAALNPA